MSDAINTSASQVALLTAQLMLAARAEGLAILAAAATDNSGSEPDLGDHQASLPSPQTANAPAAAPAAQPAAPAASLVSTIVDTVTISVPLPPASGPAPAQTPTTGQAQTSPLQTAQPQAQPPQPSTLPAAPSQPGQTIPAPAVQSATPLQPGAVPQRAAQPAPQQPTQPSAQAPQATASPAPVAETRPLQTLSPPPVIAAAVATARADAVIKQDGLAPLMADLAAAVEQSPLPAPVRAAAQQVLNLRVVLTPDALPERLKAATGASGLFLEARQAATPTIAQAPPATDMKAALLILAQTLRAWTVDLRPRTTDIVADAAPAEAEEDGAAPGKPLPPAPPLKGQGAAGQPAQRPSLPADTPAAMVRGQLLHRTEAALARQTLLQLASARAVDPKAPGEPADGPSWRFEIPIMTPQGVSVAPFEISRDGGGGSSGAGASAGWRVRFAFDIEPAGPVAVAVSLRGEHAAVSVAADRDAVAQSLSLKAPELVARLAEAGLTADVRVRAGALSAGAAPSPGRFLDRAT